MYTVCSLLDTPVEDYVKDSLPFLLAIILLVVVLLFVPELVLFLPNLVFG
jgi:TRAP-type C4-dicarboxylate transport system permease large subunit